MDIGEKRQFYDAYTEKMNLERTRYKSEEHSNSKENQKQFIIPQPDIVFIFVIMPTRNSPHYTFYTTPSTDLCHSPANKSESSVDEHFAFPCSIGWKQ